MRAPEDSPGSFGGLAFLLLSGLLLGLHGRVILGHVEDVDVLPAADGLQQAEEGGVRAPRKERVEAIKHHASVAVAQLEPETARQLVTRATERAAGASAGLFTGASVGFAHLAGLSGWEHHGFTSAS